MLAYLETINFAIFSTCFKNASAFSTYLVDLEKTYYPTKTTAINYNNHLVWFNAAYSWVDSLVFKSVTAQNVMHYAHEYLAAPALLLLPTYLFLLLILGVFLGAKFLATTRLFSAALLIAEQEFAAPRALNLLVALALCVITATLGSILFGANLTALRFLYLTSISLLLYLVALIPINLIYNWGAYFPVYIKGQSIKKNVFVELATDYIHLLSFFLRINIQLIRLVIITCVFYMYNEMYVEFIYPTLSSSVADSSVLGHVYAGAGFALKLIANLLYEVAHLWIMVGMQSGAFMMIIFVITQFLYSVYLINRLQPFLAALRSRK